LLFSHHRLTSAPAGLATTHSLQDLRLLNHTANRFAQRVELQTPDGRLELTFTRRDFRLARELHDRVLER